MFCWLRCSLINFLSLDSEQVLSIIYTLKRSKRQAQNDIFIIILAFNQVLSYFIDSMIANINIKQTLLIFALLIGFGGFFVAPAASAIKCGGVETILIKCDQTGDGVCSDGSIITKANMDKLVPDKCPDGKSPTVQTANTGIWGMLIFFINILTAGIGVAGVGGVVYGSILYTTAGGNLEQVKKSRHIIANTVVGLILYAAMFALLNFLIPGGMFG